MSFAETALMAIGFAALVVVSPGFAQDEVAIVRASTAALPSEASSIDAPDDSILALVSQLSLSEEKYASHPLFPVLKKMWSGEFGPQPTWRLALLYQGLQNEPRTAKVTAYSSRCPDGGGPWTRWGTRVRRGICAADSRYWGPGSVIWLGAPIESMLIVEDTGSAIKGPHRFDACFGADAAACSRFGVRRIDYVPLYIAPPKRRWATKPRGWLPPIPPIHQALQPVKVDALGPAARQAALECG